MGNRRTKYGPSISKVWPKAKRTGDALSRERRCWRDLHTIQVGRTGCKECAAAAYARRKANPAAVEKERLRGLEKNRKLRAEKPEETKIRSTADSKVFRANNPGYHASKMAAKRAADPEKYRRICRESFKRNPETVRANTQVKRARKANAPGAKVSARVWKQQWLALKETFGHRCGICNKTPTDFELEPDHIVPLRRGGAHDISNIVPLCKPCNASKHARMPKVENFQPWAQDRVLAAIAAYELGYAA